MAATRLTRLAAFPLNAAFRVRRPRDETYGPFTDQELRLYLDLKGGTAADQIELTNADRVLSDSDYVIDFLKDSAWTGANLTEGTWTGHLYADEQYIGGFTFEAYESYGGEHNPGA
jgi:hypothetical protein